MSDISDAGQMVTQLHCRIYPTWGSEGVKGIMARKRQTKAKTAMTYSGQICLVSDLLSHGLALWMNLGHMIPHPVPCPIIHGEATPVDPK